MKTLFYHFLILLSRFLGDWFFALVAGGIAAGYYILFPKRVATGVRFYRALFPERPQFFYLWCTFKQYLKFTTVFLDRYRVRARQDITFASEGGEHIDRVLARKTGGILVMSHLGNWDAAAHLLKKEWPDLKLLMYMGKRARDQIESLQKQGLMDSGIRIVAVDPEDSSPLDILEGVRFIENGGLVLMAGDVIWNAEQRYLPARFLGHDIRLPMAPHMLGLLTGAPVFYFFAFRLSDKQYQFYLSPPRFLKTAARKERNAVLQASAQDYADALESALRAHPFEWYHFEPFLQDGF